jgi:hypothetical protein
MSYLGVSNTVPDGSGFSLQIYTFFRIERIRATYLFFYLNVVLNNPGWEFCRVLVFATFENINYNVLDGHSFLYNTCVKISAI